ncbi:hypothetical protein M422DRAFT_56211 [Sphaerobolus stellatus SS14]|uniref:Uncharacterized protein n=1 Tax=Sphaerobolus stellatus (strain SS14) TaxID=990650 RepID=A0A0C9T7D6_SPHS4|nr:hypothetical protein M422DRAFT_56211 [Sphaerobolus stellatus SS14]
MEDDDINSYSPADEDSYNAPKVPSYTVDLMRNDFTSILGSFSDSSQGSVVCMSLKDIFQFRYGLPWDTAYEPLLDVLNPTLSLQACRNILTEIDGQIPSDKALYLTKFMSCILEHQNYSTVKTDLTVAGILENIRVNGWLETGVLTRFKTNEVEEFTIAQKVSRGRSGWLLTTPDPITTMYCKIIEAWNPIWHEL